MAHQRPWRTPTISEIARAAGVGTATVDRVVNGRESVREATKTKVMDAIAKLTQGVPVSGKADTPTISFIAESGTSFNSSLERAVGRLAESTPHVRLEFRAYSTADFDAAEFVTAIDRAAETSHGLVIVAREDLLINRALRTVSKKMPVICITTDLASSARTAYVGNDQTAAGSTAAYLMGRLVGANAGKVLIVFSAPYRVQEERELGFRRVLRSEFTHLDLDHRVNSNDDAEYSYRNVMQYIEAEGAPLGIYNVAGGNWGIGRALEDSGLAGKTVFIGHELNTNSRTLLETGLMDIVIGHDVEQEAALAVKSVEAKWNGLPVPAGSTEVKIYTKFNCNW